MENLRDRPSATRAPHRDDRASKAERRASREAVAAYHEEELAKLLEHVRDGFARLDVVEIDSFDLDDLIHHYKRAAQKLWSFCTASADHAAGTLAWMREQDDETDWWKLSQPRRRS